MTDRSYIDLEICSTVLHRMLDWARDEGIPMVFVRKGVITARAAKREIGNAIGLNIITIVAIRRCDREVFLLRWR